MNNSASPNPGVLPGKVQAEKLAALLQKPHWHLHDVLAFIESPADLISKDPFAAFQRLKEACIAGKLIASRIDVGSRVAITPTEWTDLRLPTVLDNPRSILICDATKLGTPWEDIRFVRDEVLKTFAIQVGRPLSHDDLVLAYKERIKNWPPGEKTPTRDEDVAWLGLRSTAKKETLRDIRRDHAPPQWQNAGKRKS